MKNTPWIIILILVAVIIFQRSCKNCNCPEITVTTDTIILPGDTVFTETELPVPLPVYIKQPGDTLYIYEQINVDTAAILKDYFALRFYKDTLKDDTSAFVQHNYTVTQNQVSKSKLIFKNRRPKTYITQTLSPVESRKMKFFGGLSVYHRYMNIGIAPTAGLLTKNDHLYTLQYDIFNKDFEFSIFWKISFSKKTIKQKVIKNVL